MKKMISSVVAASALFLTSAAFAQAPPSNDKAPPPATGSPGSDSTAAPTPDNEVGKTDDVKKAKKSKPGSDGSSDKTPSKY